MGRGIFVTASLVAPLTLDQLAALSDEIAALARAGVPLDRGLRDLARDLPGRLRPLLDSLGQRLESGQPLDLAIADQLGRSLPPAYGAVLTAGIRAGRLPAALEEVSRTARMVSELRQAVGLSLCYPLVVLSLTWMLGLFVIITISPMMSNMLVEFAVTPAWIPAVAEKAVRVAPIFGVLVPVLFAGWLIWTWRRSGQVAKGAELHPLFSVGAVGMLSRMRRASRHSSLARLLVLMIENGVPLPESIELASAALGSKSLATGGRELARKMRGGEIIENVPAGFPPLLAWMLASGHSPQQLSKSLTRTAEIYQEEVTRRGQWLTFYVPAVLSIVICGGVVFLYALLTLGPWVLLMRRLTQPYSLFF